MQTWVLICKHLNWNSQLFLFELMGLPKCLQVSAFRIKGLGAFPKSCCSRKTVKNFPLKFNTVFQYSWTFCLSEKTVILMSFLGVDLEEGFEACIIIRKRLSLLTWLLHPFTWGDSFVFFHLVHFCRWGCVLCYAGHGACWWDATIHFSQTALRVPFVTNCLNKNVTQVNGCQKPACLPVCSLCILYILYI